jgi:hypothetical protein
MLLYWLMWIIAGALLGLLMLWFQHGNGRKRLRRWRGLMWKRTTLVTRQTVQARRRSTARGRLREERRREPHRLTFGHRRRPDDPTLVTRAGRKAKEAGGRGVERAKLSWVNRTPITDRLERRNTERDMGPQMMCGSTRTENGHPCRNPRMLGKNHCQVHPTFLGAGLFPNAEQRRAAREERREREREERYERELDREQQDVEGNGHRSSGGVFVRREDEQEPLSVNGNGAPAMQTSHSGADSEGSD